MENDPRLGKKMLSFFFLFALTVSSKPVYFVHMHKAGGTQLCSIAKSIGYSISGSRNCGPTTKQSSNPIDTMNMYVSKALGHEEDKVVMCRKRSPPDKCNPWLRVNPFDQARIWPLRGKAYELELPLWLYEIEEEHDRVLNDSMATFMANERYLSNVVQKKLRSDNRNMCYVVMLRDPFDRSISHWRHDGKSRINLPRSTSFDDYIEGYLRNNLMTRTLCGSTCLDKEALDVKDYELALRALHLMDAVLITEQYAESLDVLQKVCGSPSSSKKWTDYMETARQQGPKIYELEGRQKRLLSKKNRWDIALYKEAKRIFSGEKKIEENLPLLLNTRFVSEYRDLGPAFTSAVGAENSVRIKFPSIFRTSAGGYRILFNLRNDRICEGYLVTARVDLRDNVSVIPYSVNDEDKFVYPTEKRRELFNGKRGLSTIPFTFPRVKTFTGPEDPRSINSPDGSMAFLIFNCKRDDGKRGMVVIDYNSDPSVGVFLSIRGQETRGEEKNWSPFFVSKKHYKGKSEDEWILHFIYSIEPTFILACPDVPKALKSKRKNVDCELVTKEPFSRSDHFAQQVLVRGSSSFIEYRWPYYVGLTHTRIPMLKGCNTRFCKSCYRAQLMIMDMEQMRPIHLSESLTFPPEFVHGLNRLDAKDSYNHYTTGLYLDKDQWYIGLDVDDQHPTLGILTNMNEYVEDVLDRTLHTYENIHQRARSMASTQTCSEERMKTAPDWAKDQSRCKSRKKPSLPYIP